MRRRHLAGLSPIAEVIPRCSLIVAVARFSRINFVSSSPQASSSIPLRCCCSVKQKWVSATGSARGERENFLSKRSRRSKKRRRRSDWMTSSGKMAARDLQQTRLRGYRGARTFRSALVATYRPRATPMTRFDVATAPKVGHRRRRDIPERDRREDGPRASHVTEYANWFFRRDEMRAATMAPAPLPRLAALRERSPRPARPYLIHAFRADNTRAPLTDDFDNARSAVIARLRSLFPSFFFSLFLLLSVSTCRLKN